MRIIELVIDGELGGINAVSVVDKPAIESNFVALKENVIEVRLAEVDAEKRIITGAALIPNKQIYRKTKDDEYYIYFSENTVRKASELFFKNGNQSNVTFNHESDLKGMTVVESWIVDNVDMDKSRTFGLNVPKGTWMITMKVENDQTWNDIKSGLVKGYSIEGNFIDKIEAKLAEDKLNLELQNMEYKNTLNQIKALLSISVKLAQMKLEDGVTVLEAEQFAVDFSVGIVTEDGIVPLPVGEYMLEDGNMLMVEVEGIIASIAPMEAAPVTEAEAAPAQVAKPEMESDAAKPKRVVESVSKETFFSEMEKMKEELKNDFIEAIKVALSVQSDKPAAKPIVHNPDAKKPAEAVTSKMGAKASITEFLNSKK
jgi:hypothetical protein